MRFQALLLVAGLALASGARGHSDEYFDSIQAPHGGQLRMAGPFHLEVVLKPGAITAYVSDHGNEPIATADARATATIATGKDVVAVHLAPAGGNVMTGSGGFTASRATRVRLSIHVPGQGSAEVNFKPVRKAPAP